MSPIHLAQTTSEHKRLFFFLFFSPTTQIYFVNCLVSINQLLCILWSLSAGQSTPPRPFFHRSMLLLILHPSSSCQSIAATADRKLDTWMTIIYSNVCMGLLVVVLMANGESDKCNLLLNVLLTGHILHDNNTWTTAVALGHPQWTEEGGR